MAAQRNLEPPSNRSIVSPNEIEINAVCVGPRNHMNMTASNMRPKGGVRQVRHCGLEPA